MSLNPANAGAPASYTGRYYALPLHGRLMPHEGGSFEPASTAAVEEKAKSQPGSGAKSGFSFAGFLDIINPLQHIWALHLTKCLSGYASRTRGNKICGIRPLAGYLC